MDSFSCNNALQFEEVNKEGMELRSQNQKESLVSLYLELSLSFLKIPQLGAREISAPWMLLHLRCMLH